MGTGGTRFGAGRPGWHVKAEHCLRLDVRDIARFKALAPGSYTWRWTATATGEVRGTISLIVARDNLTLQFSSNGQPVAQRLRLSRTACNFGGARPWLHCPQCDRRVAVLFLRGALFRCRTCGRVAYASQSDDEIDRIWRRQQRLEAQLGAYWQRPKGMHHATRERIVNAIVECEERRESAIAWFIAHMDAQLEALGGTLGLGPGENRNRRT